MIFLVYFLFFWILFEAGLALTTQALGIFYFWPVFLVNILALAIFLYFSIKNKTWKKIKMDWMLVFVFLISIASLWQVHYKYSGKINLATDMSVGYHDVRNMSYEYPYFSDEWDAVGLIKYSINSHSLPFTNPFDKSFYINFAAPFFSFLAGLMLVLRLDPLTGFNYFAIFINTLIVVICYAFLRINKLSERICAITALSVLYISCGSNLPGIWYLLPVHMGIVFSLLGFCFMALNKRNLSILCAFAVLLFYPPLIIFYGLALVIFLMPKIDFKKFGVASQLTDRLFYPSLSGNYIPQYYFYNIIPVFSLIFFAFGILHVFKNLKWLFSQIVLGIAFWILYSFVSFRIIIDYERIVFFTSIIVIIISGFGLAKVFEMLDKKWPTSKHIPIVLLVGFVLFIPFYTSQESWQKFILINPVNGYQVYPKAPANNYLTAEDISLFSGIKNKKFLSIPWKGLVIASATENYPAVTKEGIISIGNANLIAQFLNADCEGKTSLAKKQKLDYIYLYQFDCQGFEKIGTSQEGFTLYKFQ